MVYDIVLAAQAVEDFKRLNARIRSEVRDALERHLRHQPTRMSKSGIKRLRGASRPQYRLRVGDVRVFYDVTGSTVEVLAIIEKARAEAWLKKAGGQP
jgi:mRNA-degrading endonuclease RelE of RelBE toxin-antitoxin system